MRSTTNIFGIIESLTGRRRRMPLRIAPELRLQTLRRIARRYQRALRIHLVLDSLNTHCEKSPVATLGKFLASV
jgi:hypothetical protein